MRNLSTDGWVCTMPDNTQNNVYNNEVVPVYKGITLIFGGGLKGEIVE